MFGSETPRTDKEEYRTDIDETSVPAKFARELEIELLDVKDQLEQANAKIKELTSKNEALTDEIGELEEQNFILRQENGF